MNAQGRGNAGNFDPADQWVFDPNTGSYELRLNPVADDSSSTYGNARPTPPRQRRSPDNAPSSAQHSSAHGYPGRAPADDDPDAPGRTAAGEPRLPAQRRRNRAADNSPSGGRRAAGGHGRNRRKRKQPLSRKQKVLRWGGGGVALLLVAGCAGGYLVLQHLNGNINKVDVGEQNPAVTKGPVNILIIGTDAREGKGNEGYGDKGSPGHADTTLLLHVSADRSNATALSIPRDMITDIPSCSTKRPGKPTKHIPGQQDVRFNTSLGQEDRNESCTWRTVEHLTGMKVQHFMRADFNAVKELSTAVGGVPICAGHPIHDPKSHLNLTAGKHVVKGEDALAFVRTRHSIGTGSDLSRIQLQQQFLGAMVRKMKSGDTLTSPSKLYDLVDVATKALTVDSGIGSAKKLYDLAKDLRRVNTSNITFTTVPVVDNPQDPATVVLNKGQADPLFKMVRNDESLTKTKKDKAKAKAKGGKDVAEAKKAPASQVRVKVRNGGGPVGSAQETVDWLQNQKGVRLSSNAGNASAKLSKSTLEFSASQAGQAATLADMMGLPKSSLKEKSGGGKAMKLTLGKDFSGAGQPISSPHKAPSGVQNSHADKNTCVK